MKKIYFGHTSSAPDSSARIPCHAGCITKLKGLHGTAILLLISPGLTPWATNMASVS